MLIIVKDTINNQVHKVAAWTKSTTDKLNGVYSFHTICGIEGATNNGYSKPNLGEQLTCDECKSFMSRKPKYYGRIRQG